MSLEELEKELRRALRRIQPSRGFAARKWIAGLPETARTIILLRYREGRTQNEIADAIGIPTAAVRRHLQHSLMRLRGKLQEGVSRNLVKEVNDHER
jgi:DNA-directed RNA polymerase specialized sigma24 family protein